MIRVAASGRKEISALFVLSEDRRYLTFPEPICGAQHREEAGVSGRELIMVEFVAGDPAKIRAAEGLGFALFPGAAKKLQEHSLVRVGVDDGFDEFVNIDLNPQLLLEFAGEALLEGFVGMALAAGKFP